MPRKSRIDTETRKHDIRVMKNVTVTLPEDLATRARVAAARENKSLSRYIADLLAEKCGEPAAPSREEAIKALEAFWRGPGFPGASKNWKGREGRP